MFGALVADYRPTVPLPQDWLTSPGFTERSWRPPLPEGRRFRTSEL